MFFMSLRLCAQEDFYAFKLGLLSHSTGPVSSGKEDGMTIHAELLINTKLWKGYPTFGADIHLKDDTSFLYAGLSWEKKFFKYLSLGAFFGFALHNGELENGDSNRRQLGTRVLFREAVDIAYYFNDKTSVSLIYDHYSNLGLLGASNQGNDNIGLRISYYF